MTRHEYYRGQEGRKYGIYNTQIKCFQFGISEDTPMLAEARLYRLIGDDARKWRFEPRVLPPGGLYGNQTPIGRKVEQCDYKREFERLMDLPNCNNCKHRTSNACGHTPRVGETVRINCPLWEPEKEADE